MLRLKKYIYVIFAIILYQTAAGQSFDTISNWDGITQNWQSYGLTAEIVANPRPSSLNSSDHCYKIITSGNQWDNISYIMPVPANFDYYQHYRLKILAPASGGDVALKFQNNDNTFWQEIALTPTTGEWTELEFDFSGLPYDSLTTMVIFFDFQGTESGKGWYIDDIIRVEQAPILQESYLPIVVITTNGVSIPDEPKLTADMGIIFNGEGILNHVTDLCNHYSGKIGIETRGHSTQMFPKKSYGIETRDTQGQDLPVSLLGMPVESDWILYAPYTDKSMIRNVVSFEMGRRMNDIYCSRTRYCELIVNNDYKGVYVLMEKIKKDENRVNIATLKPDEISGDDITGGYILAVDWLDDDFLYNRDGWLSAPSPSYPNAKDITFQYFYPEPDVIVDAQRNYIKTYVNSAEKALIGSSFTNPITGYQKYFDLPSFVDYMLLSEISKEVDKYRLSQYFYKEKDSDGGKLYAGPAWDFNLGYGNVDYWEPGISTTGWVYSDVKPVEWSIMYWWKRLMEDSYFKNLAKTRWENLRETALTDVRLHAIIDSLQIQLNGPEERNYIRWPILGTYVWPNYNWYNNDYNDEVNYFSNFLFQRIHWMDSYFPGKVISPEVVIWAEGAQIMINLKGDYFRNHLLLTDYFKLNDAPQIAILSVEYKNPSECILNLNSNVAEMLQISVSVDEKAINTWNDLTSNKLESAGIVDNKNSNVVDIYETGGQIVINTAYTAELPELAQIYSANGQLMGTYKLEKSSQNRISHNLKPGFYIITLKAASLYQSHKFIVLTK